MAKELKYSFWFWKDKLDGILAMLVALIDYEFSDGERELIKYEIANTNIDENIWFHYQIDRKVAKLCFKIGLDGDDFDIVHIKITAPIELKAKLETMDLFQSMFQELKEEK